MKRRGARLWAARLYAHLVRHVTKHSEIIVQARRGGIAESVHRAVAALAAPDGELVECWGDPGS